MRPEASNFEEFVIVIWGSFLRIGYLMLGLSIAQIIAVVGSSLFAALLPQAAEGLVASVLFWAIFVIASIPALTALSIVSPRNLPGLGSKGPISQGMFRWFWNIRDNYSDE